jgi:NADPH:quinone reductase-like Zn-dependent oxidoreductase
MKISTPETMRAIELRAHDADLARVIRSLHVVTRPVPCLERDQVLVRIDAAPCNPSDLLFLRGRYGMRRSLPTVPGWEGAGTVIAAGPGLRARRLVGRRVACGSGSSRDGTWAEYFAADASHCIPLRRRVDALQGATLIVNPMTALGLLSLARRGRHRAVVQTGAAGQLGRMLVRLAAGRRLPLISVVRGARQAGLLRSLGAEDVLDCTDADFEDRLRTACDRRSATIAFDAVGGSMTGLLLESMPRRSRIVVYGMLSEEGHSRIDTAQVLFQEKTIESFYLPTWLRRIGFLGTALVAAKVQKLVASGEIATEIRRCVDLEEVPEALLEYVSSMTSGKVLITPRRGKAPA